MKQLVAGKSREELLAWINDPGKVRPTTVPPLNANLDDGERARIIEQIIDYLVAL